MTGWINLDAAGAAGMPRPDVPDARFEDAFRRWLLRALGEPAGSWRAGVRALCFNVYPATDAAHAVELIGAADCDPTAADWALDEVWLPSRPSLALPAAVLDADDGVLLVRRLLREALADAFAGARLKRYPRVAVGQVDGALDVMWERTPV
ncbi:MAG: hypothetical protein ACJ8HJ_09080 [Massilia sp.]|jgi:hypothetical protein